MYPDLLKAFKIMQSQKKIYQPTSFWEKASIEITNDIQKNGLHQFRNLNSTLSFFVPTYGVPTNGYSKIQVKKLIDLLKSGFPKNVKSHQALKFYLTGEQHALSDYRVLIASDNKEKLPHLHHFSESKVGNPIGQFNFNKKFFSRSSLNYLLGLSLLKKYLKNYEISTVLEIGGGFGSLGEILSYSNIENIKYINIDIPPTHFIAEYYLKQIFGKDKITNAIDTFNTEKILINNLKKFSVLCSWQIEKLYGKVDLFVNFISFQEMEPDVVENYLNHIKRLDTNWILLRNIREGKQIKTQSSYGVKDPIKTQDYINMLSEYDLIETNVHPFGYQTVDGFHSELILLKKKSL